MKLFERSRIPLTEKFMPCANPVWPLPSWLTPAADSATLKILRFGASGSSDSRLLSKRVLTSALLVLSSEAFSATVTTSSTVLGLQ